jgi:hypothetical protein
MGETKSGYGKIDKGVAMNGTREWLLSRTRVLAFGLTLLVTCAVILRAGPALAQAGRTIVIHNNTNATLFVKRWADSTPISIPPLSKRSLFNYLHRGENGLTFLMLCAGKDMSGLERSVWVSGQETHRHEIEIFPRDFGKTAIFDKPGCEYAAPHPACGFAGTWMTRWTKASGSGRNDVKMVLRRNGNSVEGEYYYQGTSKVKGTVSGNVFTGTYTQSSGTGTFRLTLDGCNSWKGTWEDAKGSGSGAWYADRASQSSGGGSADDCDASTYNPYGCKK